MYIYVVIMSNTAENFVDQFRVWKYFKFDEQAGKSICIMKLKSQGQDDEDWCSFSQLKLKLKVLLVYCFIFS